MRGVTVFCTAFFATDLVVVLAGVAFFWGFAVAFFEGDDDFSIFSDPDFNQPTNNFSPGQMVYLKVESSIDGSGEESLRILDAEKKEIQEFILNRQGNILTASFASPVNPGVYYLDVKIKDNQGSVYASQENIIVGKASSRSVSSQTVVVVEEEDGQDKEITEGMVDKKNKSTPTLAVPDKVPPKTQGNFFTKFFENLFKFLQDLFGFVPKT